MFSILPQNPQPSSAIKSKRQAFRNQIRRKQIDDYKHKIRRRMLYDNEVDYDVLKDINLPEAMHIILNYDFPRIVLEGEEIEIDKCHTIYDLEREENAPLKKAIYNVFLYMTSKMSSHVINLMEQGHVFKLAEILQRKTNQMKPYFKQKSYIERKTADDLRLPLIYQKVLIILTLCSYENTLFFEESVKYIIHVLRLVLGVFPKQTKVVEACTHSIAVSMDNKNLMDYLLSLLNEGAEEQCLLTKFLDVFSFLKQIFEYETKYYQKTSEHSIRTITSLLYFYEKAFLVLQINDLFPNMRRRIYKLLETLLENKQTTDNLKQALLKALYQMYCPNFGNMNQIILESIEILYVMLDYLQAVVKEFKEKRVQGKIEQKIEMAINCFRILNTIFQTAPYDDQTFEQVVKLIKKQVQQHIDPILQDALKLTETPLVFHALQLTKVICNWTNLFNIIYENSNILIKVFYFCTSSSLRLKKQAICCICNIIENHFGGKGYHDSQLVEIYQQLIENFDFLNILVQNLDNYTDVDLNVSMLECIQVLCYFWQADPELGKYNKFWTKFVQNGGELKLNTIISEERNEEMKKIADELLNQFVLTDVYEVEI